MTRYAALSLVLLAILAPPALGAGGPVAGSDAGPAGVAVPGNPSRFVALPAGDRTLVARIDRRGGTVADHRSLRGQLIVPAVAYDGAATGLSADGRTLVLASPRFTFQRRQSTFTILDTKRLRRQGTIRLRGDFTLDAISPDGGMLYLIELTSRRDPTRYAVRAYDVNAERLLPDPVVDPSEDEPMRGMPVSRASSPDGRWAYTLYDDTGGEYPFIHALDTERATAKCIDLDQLAGRDDYLAMLLHVGPSGTIAVRHVEHDRPLVVVDPASFTVHEPREPAPARAPEEDGGSGWLIIAGGLGLLALVAVVRARGPLRRRREAERLVDAAFQDRALERDGLGRRLHAEDVDRQGDGPARDLHELPAWIERRREVEPDRGGGEVSRTPE